MVQFVTGNAKDFEVALCGFDAGCGPKGDDRAVFMFHPMSHFAVGKEVQEVVLRCREGTKGCDLGPGECDMVGHELIGVLGQGVVNPNVEVDALLAVDVVPKAWRRDPRRVHDVLNIPGFEDWMALDDRPWQGCGERPTFWGIGREREVRQGDGVSEVFAHRVKHHAIHRIHVQQLRFHACGSCIQDVGMEHPSHLLNRGWNVPGMKVAFAQKDALAMGIHALDRHEVLCKIPQFIASRTPHRQMHRPRPARGEVSVKDQVLVGNISCDVDQDLRGVAEGRGQCARVWSTPTMGCPVAPLG